MLRTHIIPAKKIKGSVACLSWLLANYRVDVGQAVVAYNTGEGAVDRHNGMPPYKEI
ncbi:MAG TPA: lytic transglycosylase domain-containing protein [Methylophilaceae bacterium]|nr:lytic transglycosylase domain-containing protein [Methylophilaceae bacterium]